MSDTKPEHHPTTARLKAAYGAEQDAIARGRQTETREPPPLCCRKHYELGYSLGSCAAGRLAEQTITAGRAARQAWRRDKDREWAARIEANRIAREAGGAVLYDGRHTRPVCCQAHYERGNMDDPRHSGRSVTQSETDACVA